MGLGEDGRIGMGKRVEMLQVHMYGMSIKFIIIKLLNRYKWVLFMIVDNFGGFK